MKEEILKEEGEIQNQGTEEREEKVEREEKAHNEKEKALEDEKQEDEKLEDEKQEERERLEDIEPEELLSSLLEERREKELYQERLLRFKADFENHKKRVIKERERIIKQANKGLIEGLLPIIDNLDRAVSSKHEDDEHSAGVRMIIKQLMDYLSQEGLEEVEALGQVFDPCYHEAVERVESSEHESDTIVQVLQKGYCFKGDLLRAAVVKVAQ